MSGAALAAVSGVGYGVFQSFNRRAVGGLQSLHLGIFLQLVTALGVLAVASAATGGYTALAHATAAGVLWFLAAGVVHFFCGWTCLNLSQARIGAARTSPLTATTPVFGAALAALTLGELPDALAWLGILLVVAGAIAVAIPGISAAGGEPAWRDAAFGVGAGLSWGVSPVLIRHGLNGLDSPLAGLTVGLALAVAMYAAVLALSAPGTGARSVSGRGALAFKLLAGLIVGLATWGRYAALEDAAVGVVLALSLLSVPTVLVLAPLLVGRHLERITALVWSGAGAVIGGSLLLVVDGS
jgi:O-acetylserine/cysteine efflux transporter